MGSGRWSSDVYSAAENFRRSTGQSAFAYSDSGARRVHPSLDPYGVTRESRDSAEHPDSTAIAVLFDVTGSMRHVPRTLQAKLPGLLSLLQHKGYCPDPQLLFGAIGDATCDKVPLQIGQFESDNRMDDDLGRIVLEGGGGGQRTESYELAMYFMAKHTEIDCWTKRRRKGFLFIIGDELPYPRVKGTEVERVIGSRMPRHVSVEAIVASLKERYEVFYLLPSGSAYAGDREILDHWRRLLGQNVLQLDDLDAVCETIAVTIGLACGVDLDTGLADLAEIGSGAGRSVARTLGGARWI